MTLGTIFGPGVGSVGLYGTGSLVNQTYFEWFVFKESVGQPATPTGGSWDFLTNTGTAPTEWSALSPAVPVNPVWFSTAFVDSRNPTLFTWTEPSKITAGSAAAAVDISFAPIGNVTSTNVQFAIAELATTYLDNFTGDGTTVDFTLTASPHSENTMQVFVNGVYQQKNSFSVVTDVLTFSEAPPLTSTIEVTYY